jgi:two-component system LytT family sensor kinase
MIRLFRHILFWTIYVALEFLANYFHYSKESRGRLLLYILIYLPVIIPATYVSALVLVPRFLLTKKYFLFAFWLGLIALLVITYRYFMSVALFTNWWDNMVYIPLSKVVKNTIKDYAVIALASSLFVIHDWQKLSWRLQQLERSRAEVELALLLNQLQPHFLFNSFNNIYSLIRKDPEKGGEALLQLSSVLEYIVYLKPGERVLFEKELQVVKDYIALQRLKYGEDLLYEEKISPAALKASLPSLVLLSLMENAFKHGKKKEGKMYVFLLVERIGEDLIIRLRNSAGPQKSSSSPGRGKELIDRRLRLFYPERTSIFYRKEGREFQVELKIPANEV